MKRLVVILISVLAIALCFSACSKGEISNGTNESSSSKNTKTSTPLDLKGTWKQVNSNSDDSWQEATITDDTIEIYWVSDDGDTKSLYWAGTYVAPQGSESKYSWDSVNDHEKTDLALMASESDTKTITYENKQLSYSASAMGTTTTVRLELVK